MLLRMALARFQLLTEGTDTKLSVNGQEVAGLAGVQLVAQPGQVAQLIVQQTGDVLLEGEGVVHVRTGEGSGARAAVLEWLELLDAEAIERQALDRQGWGSGGLGAEMLDVLKELAKDQLPE